MTKKVQSQSTDLSPPPIVVVLGHVNHGKTTLLDKIRNATEVNKEYGGITQRISAYQVNVYFDKKKSLQKITFIDTPGHYAFAKMRSRGANVANIAILVIAVNDGIMPQTKESIAHITSAKLPLIVALNKIDLPGKNIEKIKKQLVTLGLQLEEYGGDTPVVKLSAKTGEGIDKLLEMIILLSELYPVKQDVMGLLNAVVIESSRSSSYGIEATVIVKSGYLKKRAVLRYNGQEFKVKAIYNWQGKNISQAKPSDPVKIIGWNSLPPVGSLIIGKDQTKITSSSELSIDKREELIDKKKEEEDEEKVNLILKTDMIGSQEAVVSQIPDKIHLIHSGIGDINESDVLLAKTSQAFIVGFGVKANSQVIKLAKSERVIIKTYNIIYNLVEETTEVVDAIIYGKLEPILGEAKILALFPIKERTVAGVKVIEGRLNLGDNVKVTRKEEEIGRAKIKSLRLGKKDIKSAKKDAQAGVLLSTEFKLLTGDSIIAIG